MPNHASAPTQQGNEDAYAAYWFVFLDRIVWCLSDVAYRAAYGYDVNSAEFKKWQAEQQQQYAQCVLLNYCTCTTVYSPSI